LRSSSMGAMCSEGVGSTMNSMAHTRVSGIRTNDCNKAQVYKHGEAHCQPGYMGLRTTSQLSETLQQPGQACDVDACASAVGSIAAPLGR
jgi:hypothetical protein